MACFSCGSDAPVTARFCPACGHALVNRDDERRVVTVLFADLAGFTGLSETLDPERLKNIVDRSFAALASDVTGHGGLVDKVVGDAIVALFGAPAAHGDDPERAVRAGLQMQRTIATLATDLSARLRLRVGINTGEVLVGAMRAGGDYTAMGDVVNVASRLQTMAEPGSVVAGEQTYLATARVVHYEPLGMLQPRGREAPVRAWQAVGVRTPPGRRPRRSSSPLLGRDHELAVLGHTLTAAVRRARPTLALVLGEAGVGKTRLTEEVAAMAAAEHGALVLEGRCLPYGEANPWWPLAEAVRRACGVEPGDAADIAGVKVRTTVEEVCDPGDGTSPADTASGLLHLMGDSAALADVDPHRSRHEARRALNALVAGLARRQPVLMVLSELHWADEVVLDLLGFHLERMGGLPVAVLATGRPELLQRWSVPQGRHDLLTLHLDPLDRQAARELAQQLNSRPLPPDSIDALVERSGGNPLFLEELVAFVGDADGAGGDPLSGHQLPVTLRGLIAERLDALPRRERSLIEDAAVVGRSGTVPLLAALASGRAEPDVEAVLDRLLQRDLLVASNPGWEFRSELVRDVVYETLTKADRARRHWAVAGRLGEQGRRTGRQDELLELVAHHYATAAELSRVVGPLPAIPPDAGVVAVDALRQAARWAARRELPLAARRMLDRAVALAPEGSDTTRALLVERASERATLRDLAGARQDLEVALTGPDRALQAAALTTLGYVQQLEGDLPPASRTLRRAMALWREVGNRAGEGEALRRFGICCLQENDLVTAEAALMDALAIARELEDRRDEAWALWHLAELSYQAGRTDETVERLHRAGRAFRDAGDTGGLGWVKGLLGYVAFSQGRRHEAEQMAAAVLGDTRDRGDPWALAMILLLLASVRLWQGRAGSALEPAAEAARTFGSIRDLDAELRAAGLLARALAATGRAAEAWQVIDELCERAGVPVAHPSLAAAAVAAHLGDARYGLTDPGPAQGAFGGEEAVVTRAVTLLQLGRAPEACDLLDGLLAGENRVTAGVEPGLRANAHAVAALARVCSGHPDRALEAAGEVLAAVPAATYRDVALARVARAFALGRQGDMGAARDEIDAATVVAGPTDDRVTAATTGLAAAWLHGEEADRLAARAALRELGAVPEGWDAVFFAARGEPLSRSSRQGVDGPHDPGLADR